MTWDRNLVPSPHIPEGYGLIHQQDIVQIDYTAYTTTGLISFVNTSGALDNP